MERKDREKLIAAMQKAGHPSNQNQSREMAALYGAVYDPELPVPSVIEAIADVKRAEVGEDVDYLTPTDPSEKVFTISANCTVTQNKVSPSSDAELSFTDLISDERYTCLHDWLKGKHDVLKLHTDAIMENMNRYEEYTVLQLVDAGAVAKSNTYTLRSGETTFIYPDLVDMANSLRKFGRKLVLISGANVSSDIDLMDYNKDTNREYNIDRIVDTWIRIEAYNVNISGSDTDVIDADVAYLVAVSDSAARKPILFARRKTMDLATSPDTEASDKERVIIVSGNLINAGSDRKLSRSVVGFGEIGGVALNTNCFAKFTRS